MFVTVFVGRSATNILIRTPYRIRRFDRHRTVVLRTFKVGRSLVFLSVSSRRNGLYRASNKGRAQASHPINRHARVRRKYTIYHRPSGRRFSRGKELKARYQLTCVIERDIICDHRFLKGGLTNRMGVHVPIGLGPCSERTNDQEQARPTGADYAVCDHFGQRDGRLFCFLDYRAVNLNRSRCHQDVRVQGSVGFNVRHRVHSTSRRRSKYRRGRRTILGQGVCGLIRRHFEGW